jgi:predicted Zn-dependent peptidase
MTQDKLDNQRDVVKNERRWRVDNQPYGDWDERLQETLYPASHPYHHSVIGSMADIDAASLEDVEAFFRTYYAPNNAVLSIVGGFERERAVALVERYFGEIPAGPPIPPLPGQPELPATLQGEIRAIVYQAVSLPRLYLGYRIPTYGTAEHYAASVATAILTWGKASTLYRGLVRGRLAQDVVGYAFPIVVGAAMQLLWVTAQPGVDPEQLEAATLEHIARLADIDDAEVERAVNLMETRYLAELQKVDERADLLSMYATLFDDPARINTELDRIRGVRAEDVRAFARACLGEANRALIWYLPEETQT